MAQQQTSLFDELVDEDFPVPTAPASNDPLARAQKLAKKMPYLPRKRGERQKAGQAICRLLLASLEAANDDANSNRP